MINRIILAVGTAVFSQSGAFAQSEPVRSFEEAADQCFKYADDRSEWAASQVPDYDGDDAAGMIASGLSLSIERKRLRKKIYASCMEGNGFPNAKLVKSKPET